MVKEEAGVQECAGPGGGSSGKPRKLSSNIYETPVARGAWRLCSSAEWRHQGHIQEES